jgi:hypothetical protein
MSSTVKDSWSHSKLKTIVSALWLPSHFFRIVIISEKRDLTHRIPNGSISNHEDVMILVPAKRIVLN